MFKKAITRRESNTNPRAWTANVLSIRVMLQRCLVKLTNYAIHWRIINICQCVVFVNVVQYVIVTLCTLCLMQAYSFRCLMLLKHQTYTLQVDLYVVCNFVPDTTSTACWRRGRLPLPRAAKPLVYLFIYLFIYLLKLTQCTHHIIKTVQIIN